MKPWKSTASGVAAVALLGGLLILGWVDSHRLAREQTIARPAPARVTSNVAIPSRSDVSACNKYAASEVTVVERGAIPAVVGASDGGSVYGLEGSRKQDERSRVAYGSG